MKFSAVCNLQDDSLSRIVTWLVISCLALFPVGRLAELPLVLLALIGVKVLFENIKNNAWEKSSLFFSLFFLCLWMPIICSVPDSYKISKTATLAIEYLRFFLAGLAVLKYCLDSECFKLINKYSLFIVSFWIFDALIQLFWGTDLFGYTSIPQRLNGVFGHKYKLGLFLSVYSPFVFLLLNKNKHLFFSYLLNLLCLIVVLLAGSRGGWIMYGVVLLTFLAYKWRNDLKMFATSVGVLIVCLMAISTVLYHSSNDFAGKMDTTLKIFKGDEKSIDQAISFRVPIWKTALAMINAHPINGVGARVFRYAYPEFSEKDDRFLALDDVEKDRERGAYHSHQMQLEVLSETGFIGGFFFLGGMGILVWFWRSRSEFQKTTMLPYALGITALFFPLNTHYALYSSSWAQVIYWLVPLYFAAGTVQNRVSSVS